MAKEIYVHMSREHNMEDPNEIVPILYKYFSPRSVIDFGCGIGNFLYKFKECGAQKVLGIDGEWSNTDMQMLKGNELLLKNLTDDLGVKERFDLATSFEVAEHLDKKYAEKIINDLTSFSDLVVFSAALPNQGGQNHVNEQWPDYWVKLLNAKGYDCYDVMRQELWNNPKVKFWYKQNMFVAVNSANQQQVDKLLTTFPDHKSRKNIVLPIIHPEQFKMKLNRIDRLVRMFKGKASLKEYKEEVIKVFSNKYR